ncbi:hypothetical protein [Noviherbaspirillum pedocola]|uniref:Uncharacterized protein n=1 Tax=Noviherbaspirillum pedocola TaxID=2801341 RepID=A0A934SZQ1_9BURK|nr:hypothetical protein [Noviherbaspirillum pedocola]MBK4735992.1 hypothetical protein [Noviherbaspirillum pedocola]
MNLKSAMTAFGMVFGRKLHTHAYASANKKSSHATPHNRIGGLLMVYRCNTHTDTRTCQCGMRFTPDTGVWPHGVESGEPICMACDRAAFDITTEDRLARAAAQAEFHYNIPQEISMQVVTALRAKRGL